jgi:hypothetical protein
MIPTDTLYMTIDKEAVRKSGMMMASDSIPDRMVISLKGKSALYKGDLMILEMLAECNWVRPIYVAVSVGDDNYINLGDNTITEGLVYRITPFTTNHNGKPIEGASNFDTEKTYNNVMNRFKFGGIDKPGIYLDETVMRMCFTHRRIISQLALRLTAEGKNEKAAKVLNFLEKNIPTYNVPHSYSSGSLDVARAWLALGNNKKAMEIINALWLNSAQYTYWFNSLSGSAFNMSQDSWIMHFYIMQQLLGLVQSVDEKWYETHYKELGAHAATFEQKGGKLGI